MFCALPSFTKYLLLGILFLFHNRAAQAQSIPSNLPLDSLIKRLPVMMRSNEDSARQMIHELEQRSHRQQHRHGMIQSLFFNAWLSYRHDPADMAIQKIDSALKHVESIDKDTALVNFYILKGQCFVKKTQFSHALASFKQALKVAEERDDQVSKTSTLISIGWAYMEDGKAEEAIHFFNEVLRINPSPLYENRSLLLCNIAACYNTLGEYRQAEIHAKEGVAAARSSGNNANLANGLNILARSLYQQGKIKKAIAFLKEASVVRAKVADPSMLASDYLELADLYNKNKEYGLAIEWAKKAEALSANHANALKLTDTYEALAKNYEATGDFKNATIYFKKLLSQKENVADKQYQDALAQMRVQFETQKKTAENLQLKKENLEAKLKNSHQQRWLMFMGSGLILLVASGIYISQLMKNRYRTRLALEQLNEQKKRTKAVMEAEEKERRRIAGDLHDGVGQTLAAALLQLDKARKGRSSLDRVDELIAKAGTEVRTLSHQVTPELLLHYGLVKALEQEINRLNEANDKTTFTLYTHMEEPLQDDMVSLTLYRCFQELCANILKHAQASAVTVQLNLLFDEVQLLVEDDGVGFQPENVVFGLGLKNMQSRIAIYDGVLELDSTRGKGTTSIINIQRSAWQAGGAKTTG